MILDKIAEDGPFLARVKRLTGEGKLELVVASVTEREVDQISDGAKRALIASVPRTTVGTLGFLVGYSLLDVDRLGPEEPIEAIRQGREKEIEDALIAATAEGEGLTLVTEDLRLRGRVERRGSRVDGWHQLRRDIEQLG